jgi:hypothetical protein
MESPPSNLFQVKGIRFHERVINEFSEFNLEEELKDFEIGQTLLKSEEKRDKVIDNLRYFAEECDQIQGFQMMLDADSAFAGLGTELLTEISDEFSKTPTITFGLTPHSDNLHKEVHAAQRLKNHVLTFYELVPLTSVYVPLSNQGWASQNFRFGNFEQNSFHHSAIFASGIYNVLSLFVTTY